MANRYGALLDGKLTTASKRKGYWLVGGDYVLASQNVTILLPKNIPAWYTLKGNRLVFSDYACKQDVERVQALLDESLVGEASA